MKKRMFGNRQENFNVLRNKKGDTQLLMPEVLKVLLGVIAVVLLFILAVKIWEIMSAKTQIEQAKSTLNQIQIAMGNLQEDSKEEYLVLSPK